MRLSRRTVLVVAAATTSTVAGALVAVPAGADAVLSAPQQGATP